MALEGSGRTGVSAAGVYRDAALLRSAAAWLEEHGVELLTLSTLPALGPATSSGGERVATSGVSDPTGSAATSAQSRREKFVADRAVLVEHIAGARTAAASLIHTVSTMAVKIPKADRPVDDDAQCRQGCGAEQERGRRGNCGSCDRWLDRHPYPDGTRRNSVPADVIDRRKAVRASQKVRVSGPNAGELV